MQTCHFNVMHTHNFFMMTSSTQKFFGGEASPSAPPLDETLPIAQGLYKCPEYGGFGISGSPHYGIPLYGKQRYVRMYEWIHWDELLIFPHPVTSQKG